MDKNIQHFKRCYIGRFDRDGKRIYEGNYLRHYSGLIYKVIFSTDLLAFGLISLEGDFEFMVDWNNEEWSVIKDGKI